MLCGFGSISSKPAGQCIYASHANLNSVLYRISEEYYFNHIKRHTNKNSSEKCDLT